MYQKMFQNSLEYRTTITSFRNVFFYGIPRQSHLFNYLFIYFKRDIEDIWLHYFKNVKNIMCNK